MHPTGQIKIEDYNYPLPDERIAKFPLEKREQSKLLFLRDRHLSDRNFFELPDLLPENALLLFNETKVIRARLNFQKETGARIEIFCLEPVEPSNDFQVAFQQPSPVVWKCLVGNAKRWKSGNLRMKIESGDQVIELCANKIMALSDTFLVEFNWLPESVSFAEIIELSGLVPLPPYLNREAVETDKLRYQTVYAKYDGSVAAPTAGLHFTNEIINKLHKKGVETAKVTLHVGAGTFKPVVADQIADHEMHTEQIVVSLQSLKQLKQKINDPIIPVGTTSMRTLESLYWMALKLQEGDASFEVEQWDPYQLSAKNFSSSDALEVLIRFLEKYEKESLQGETRLMIATGYKFRFATGLITNFHQPKSTLLLLVSALIGPQWKEAYNFALQHNFRFLSYGDSCLFLP